MIRLIPEEKTALMVEAAFEEVERIMIERGLTPKDVAGQYLHRAMFKLCHDEDREQMRSKLHAAISAEVDGFFDSIGD